MWSQESQVSSFVFWRLQNLWEMSYLWAEHYRTDSDKKTEQVDRYGFTPTRFPDLTVLNQ